MSETNMPEAQRAVLLTGDLVSAYVANNHVALTDLPALIASVHGTLTQLSKGGPVASESPTIQQTTSAQIRKSITPDALISFVDGMPYKTLKRHLTKHGLTMDGYRARYGLPADYPSTSPNYSAKRSELAKGQSLGHYRARQAAE